jgi:hypothetical protein
MPGKSPPLAAMLTYNVLAASYLIYLALNGEFVGKLLWMAAILHSVLAILFVRAWFSRSPTVSLPEE